MYKVKVGMATCGISAGAKAAYEKLAELVQNDGGLAELGITGCIGMCYREPLVEVYAEGSPEHFIYGGVDIKPWQNLHDVEIVAVATCTSNRFSIRKIDVEQRQVTSRITLRPWA